MCALCIELGGQSDLGDTVPEFVNKVAQVTSGNCQKEQSNHICGAAGKGFRGIAFELKDIS